MQKERRRIPEKLVSCLWADQRFIKMNLCTTDACGLEVYSPGIWNLEAGPDFHHALIKIEGKGFQEGDVEIHPLASQWEAHHHHRDPQYNRVILHVVMWNDRPRRNLQKENGDLLPQLELVSYLDRELASLEKEVDMTPSPWRGQEGFRAYLKNLVQKGFSEIKTSLEQAGDERLLRKSEGMKLNLKDGDYDQLIYTGMMDALGFKGNRFLFRELASSVSLHDLQAASSNDDEEKRGKIYQAILLNMANLLPKMEEKPLDHETLLYLQEINGYWQIVGPSFSERMMPKEMWRHAGVRPANFPGRRIAAISHLLAKYLQKGLLQTFIQGLKNRSSLLLDLLSEVSDSYWSFRYTLGGKKQAKGIRLIGRERASGILVNVVFPALLLYAREEHDRSLESALRSLYERYPAFESNATVRLVTQLLFGETRKRTPFPLTARLEQGLLQLFQNSWRDYTHEIAQAALRF
ncbi:MAG: DUF2851 family protein [Candidatus Tectomicrobia bacterium]|nr:DUF2851 family protein [Candidatus Tectomicrobia bacterium]